jgi:hypothetical protein
MEHTNANWILDSSATTNITRNPRFLDEVKPHIGSPSRIKSTTGFYHDVKVIQRFSLKVVK